MILRIDQDTFLGEREKKKKTQKLKKTLPSFLITGYDVPLLNEKLDWIAVMTYDFHGQWDKKTGHLAPIRFIPGDDVDYFNVVK